MSDFELFKEAVSRLGKVGITIVGYDVYSCNGKQIEFNAEGYNLAYNLYRLGTVLAERATFN